MVSKRKVTRAEINRRNLVAGVGASALAASIFTGNPLGSEAVFAQNADKNMGLNINFVLPPVGNFHTLNGIAQSVPARLGYIRDVMMVPGAIYLWASGEYFYLAAEESSAVSEDALSFTYVVREGIKWSDGTEFTAADVYLTFMLRNVAQDVIFNFIESIELVDEKTVVFTYSATSPVVEYRILRETIVPSSVYGQFLDGAIEVFESGDEDQRATLFNEISSMPVDDVVVSGPFKIDMAQTTSSELAFVKNETGYRVDDILFDTMTIYSGLTENITPLVFEGKVMYSVNAFPVATAQQFESSGIRVMRPTIYTGSALYFNFARHPEFLDKRVRQAFAYMLDRAPIGQISLGDSGAPTVYLTGLSDQALEKWTLAEDREKLTDYSLDAEKGHAMLEEAGWTKDGDTWKTPDGEVAEYELLYPSDYLDWAAAAQVVAEQMTALGFKVTPIGVESSIAVTDVQGANFDLTIQSWGSSNPFPNEAFRLALMNLNYPELGEGGGINFPMEQEVEVLGETVNLVDEIQSNGFGTMEEMVVSSSRLALCMNELLPTIPLVERYANAPVVESQITGMPEEGDPLMENSVYSDNPFAILMYQSILGPTE